MLVAVDSDRLLIESMNILKRFGPGRTETSLLILDDLFPHLLSSWRIAEYNGYLERYDKSVVHSTSGAFPVIGEERSFAAVREEFVAQYPQFAGRVFPFEPKRPQAQFAYFLFLHNVRHFLRILNKSRTPFAFTLYPGFQMNDETSDTLLRKVCASPNLKKIITTQKLSHEYVLDFIEPEKVEFIYGGVFPSSKLVAATPPRKYFQRDKATFDICFVAFKYMPKGIDKGYDVFVSVARALSRLYDDMQFHVVGRFDSSDIDVSDFKDRIHFYGMRQTDFFPQFHANMDLILSPNVPFVCRPGAFDGFPTGACIEAALCGVPVFCTDILRQNIVFKDGEEIVIIPRDTDEICELINHYYRNYDRLLQVGRRGQQAFERELGLDAQLPKRFRIMDKYLS